MNSSVGDLHPLHLKAAAKSWARDDNKHAPSINKVKWRSQVVQNVNQPVFIKISATSQCKPKNHTNPKQRVLHLTKWLVVSVQKYAKSLHFESFITSHFTNSLSSAGEISHTLSWLFKSTFLIPVDANRRGCKVFYCVCGIDFAEHITSKCIWLLQREKWW